MDLIAKISILYRGKQYSAGELLPADDETMVNLWIEAKSAEFKETTIKVEEPKETVIKVEAPKETTIKVEAPKAKEVAAQAGVEGTAINSEIEENLIGRVPKTAARSKGKK